MAGPYRAPVLNFGPNRITPSSPPAPSLPPIQDAPSSSYQAMIIVLVVLLLCCLTSRIWWFWRATVARRRHAEAARDVQDRDLENVPLDRLPDDAITAAVKKLPEIVWSDTAHNETSSTEDAECRLCLEDYSYGDKVRLLPCGHCYHSTCIDVWLAGCRQQGMPRGERTCPLCKRDPLEGNLTVRLHRSSTSSPANVANITIWEAISQFLLTGDVQGRVIFSHRRVAASAASRRPGTQTRPDAMESTSAEPEASGTAGSAQAQIVVVGNPIDSATSDAHAEVTTMEPA